MKIRLYCIFFFLSSICFGQTKTAQNPETVSIVIAPSANSRIEFGALKLKDALQRAGYNTELLHQNSFPKKRRFVVVGKTVDANIKNTIAHYKLHSNNSTAKEGFSIVSSPDHNLVIAGTDNSGALYGCMELADRIRSTGKMPDTISFADHPQMVLRGACIGLQKSTYLPGRKVYEYPYTPETFPWFYDKALWIKYLDMLVENRMNSLYLWNGHPFASLVRLKDYPYAVEVDSATFKKNEEIFSFLTKEADKRGIWVIQTFYNIIVSKPFAEHNGLATQDRNRHIIPIIADYTRKSIAAFVQKYPNVGLMLTLGEAMEGVGQDDIDWFTKTIIPGVKDGMKALGTTLEPPIILRAHDTDAPSVIEAALPLYKNLYTAAKYNGEALTTYAPRGPWADLHRKLSGLGSVQIENVHILANLEPFRYGAPDFIQKCVQAMHSIYHSNGLHLYPQASYWDWPYTADKTDPRLLQIDRDWIWYKAWSRYAWDADRDSVEEANYWSNELAKKYGTDVNHGKDILEAYEQQGEIAPKLLRRFGITDGNRQTLSLGMFMTQLINPYRYGLFTLLYNSEAPEGEMLTEYAEKEWKHEKHIGETPVQIINEVKENGAKAIEAIDKASPAINANKAEFVRLKNDMYIYNALANNYAEKASAALDVLRYKYSNDVNDLEKGYVHLQKSLEWYKKLVDLTKNAYLYANSMQTGQRKIPIGGNDGKNKTWSELLPYYQQELNNFRKNIDSLKSPNKNVAVDHSIVLKNVDVTLITKPDAFYSIETGKEIFTDTATYIKNFAEELSRLNGLKLSKSKQIEQGTTIKFSSAQPVKALVGYFNSPDRRFLQEPQLETDASANDYGQAEIKIANALIISGMPPVNIHAFSFKAGTNTLTLPKGACLILGFVDDSQAIPVHDAGLQSGGVRQELDWLFEAPSVSPGGGEPFLQPSVNGKTANNANTLKSDVMQPVEAPLLQGFGEAKLRHYIDYFNSVDSEYAVNYVPNAKAYDWLSQNIPLFECPDTTIEKIYYYRWWTVRKHLKQTPDGYVFTEFITPMGHAGKHNTISSALGHHIYELRWLHDQQYLNDYINFWLYVDPKTPKPHLHAFSGWLEDAVYHRYLVNLDKNFLQKNISALDADYKQWEEEKQVPSGLFWQFDVRDAMEESISGSRKEKNRRPTINSYMYGNAVALSKMADVLSIDSLKSKYTKKANQLRKLVEDSLWDNHESFFKVLHTTGKLDDAREELGYIPWYFDLPEDKKKYAKQWNQLLDTNGFKAPWGITTAERRAPSFRTHGSGHGCEWDGAVWPFATTQTLKGLSNLLTDYRHRAKMNADVFYEELHKYAFAHQKRGLPYIGEYQDEKTGEWLKGDNPRSSYYNHSCFADLVINDLIGLKPREDNVVEIYPLIPKDKWNWFCLDKVFYHGKMLTILWDKDGSRYKKGKGFKIYSNGMQIYSGNKLKHITAKL